VRDAPLPQCRKQAATVRKKAGDNARNWPRIRHLARRAGSISTVENTVLEKRRHNA
jgi:hypothetical protein